MDQGQFKTILDRDAEYLGAHKSEVVDLVVQL